MPEALFDAAHCGKGHRRTEGNTRVTNGRKYCRDCARQYARDHRVRKTMQIRRRQMRVYLHDHSVFGAECNEGCGYYWAKQEPADVTAARGAETG